MATDSLREAIQHELEAARAARGEGNEGRARVCARRAAGWAAGAYLEHIRGEPGGENALQSLQRFQNLRQVSPDLQSAAARLTTHVEPDHHLPHPEDPLEDARWLVHAVLEALGWF